MKAKEFDKLANYDHWIVKDVDDTGELIHIRYVEYGFETADLLRKNGYERVYSGCSAVGFALPGYREVLVQSVTSSEGPEGTILATKTYPVFDEAGKKVADVWDTRHCGVGGGSHLLIARCNEWTWRFTKLAFLHEKYIEFYEKLAEHNREKGRSICMTIKELREAVDGGKSEEMLTK